MKRKYIYSSLFLLSLLAFASCGKYGYDFENGYNQGDSTGSEIEKDTVMFVADKSLYPRARIFPGLVGENVTRIADTTLTLDLSFEYGKTSDRKVQMVPQPIFSTGLYAPAGELIRVEVPSGLIGLTLQIGVHQDNLSGKTPLRRDAIIYTVKELFPGVNYVRNLYGGAIWVRPNISIEKPVELKIAGGVRSSDFILGTTDVSKWIADVQANDVPWLELRSKHVTFNVPRTSILSLIMEGRLQDIDQVMKEWDEIYQKDYYDWMGFTPDAAELKNKYPNLPERGVLDIQPSAGYGHNGNPWVATNDRQWLDEWVNLTTISSGRSWGTYHEIGHNYQQVGTWSWSGLGETTNNLFVFNGLRRHGVKKVGGAHPSLNGAFENGLKYAAKSTFKNQITDEQVNGDDAPFVKILPFLQIFNKAVGKNGQSGWDFMPYIYNSARNVEYSFGVDEAKRDFFYRSLCDFTGRDYVRFCNAWGIVVSAIARAEMAKKYPPLETKIWEYNPLTDQGGDKPLDPKYDFFNSSWTILEKSSEEATGEGATNGKATAMIDGNLDTYWHSQWSGSVGVLPHTFTIDFNSSEMVKGFYLTPRSSGLGQHPRDIEIHVSTDNSTYRELTEDDLMPGYSFQMASSSARKEFRLKNAANVRFVKIYFRHTNHNGASHHAVGEFGAFYDID